MQNNLVFENDQNKPIAPDELLKTTALLYFKEALVNQRYEECPALIQKAKRYGARQSEVRQVIAEYRNGSKARRRNGADQALGGRLRFH